MNCILFSTMYSVYIYLDVAMCVVDDSLKTTM